MPKRFHIDDEDAELFREEVSDVRPLRHEGIEPFRVRPKPRPRPRKESEEELEEAFPESLTEAELETPDYLLFARPGIQHRVVHDLQRGRIEVELVLDLHGLTTGYARSVLAEFLLECRRRRVRCAQIIHGKGRGSENRQPVLKQKLNAWLRGREEVLAFCSALPRDGGTGATYLLLRHPEKHRRRGRPP